MSPFLRHTAHAGYRRLVLHVQCQMDGDERLLPFFIGPLRLQG